MLKTINTVDLLHFASTTMSYSILQADHIEAFPSSGYKRSFDSISGNPLMGGEFSAAKHLEVPNAKIAAIGGRISATSSKPDQGVNVRIPMARTCETHLTVGQLAFVWRNAGVQGTGGIEISPPTPVAKHGGLERVISMEQLNECLSLEENQVDLNGNTDAGALFKASRAKSIYKIESRFVAKRADPVFFAEFDRSIITNSFHPLLQYALDGIVCSSVDGDEHDNDGYAQHSSHASRPVCNVAIYGPCPLTVLHMPSVHDRGFDVSSPVPAKARTCPNVFVEPVRILSDVFVVLVAERKDNTATKWTFSYNVVSQSNLDIDPPLLNINKNFRSFPSPLSVYGQLKTATRLTVEVFRLGKITDCKFGASNAPQIVVAVNVKKFEPVEMKEKYETEFPGDITKPKLEVRLLQAKPIWRAFSNYNLKKRRGAVHERRVTLENMGGPLVKLRSPFGKLRNITSSIAFGNSMTTEDLDKIKASVTTAIQSAIEKQTTDLGAKIASLREDLKKVAEKSKIEENRALFSHFKEIEDKLDYILSGSAVQNVGDGSGNDGSEYGSSENVTLTTGTTLKDALLHKRKSVAIKRALTGFYGTIF